MKVNDLNYYDVLYNDANNVNDNIAKLRYYQKYIMLETPEGLKDLEIEKITDNKIILKIREENHESA